MRSTKRPIVVASLVALMGYSTPVDVIAQDYEVTIYRDDWGVPHLYAENEAAGYFGLGYVQAEDQGERILRLVVRAIGRAAAIDGEAMFASDVEAHRWMHDEESRDGFDRLSPHIRANYEALVAGFNRYFQENPNQAPDWRFDLEGWHLIAIPRGSLWGAYMAGDGISDCLRGGAQITRGQAAALQERANYASNQWVLHPERTADNVMIMLSDPHGGIDGGFVHEFRMHAGEIAAAGYTLGGAMVLTHTRNLTWGMTTGAPDVSDCYVVKTDPENPLRYQYDGAWREMTTRDVAIKLRDGEERTLTFAYTHHNEVLSPVIARDGATAYVVSTPYMHDPESFDEEFDKLNRARNVEEARNALRGLGMFAQNLMFADSEGNSWYVRAGRTPLRDEAFDWSLPVPGNTSETAWRGMHSIDDLVQISNPPQGYMQNNNISPDQMTRLPSPISAEDYETYIFNDTPGRFNARGRRANQVLSAAEQFTVTDAIELALDEKWPATEVWLGTLREVVESEKEAVEGWAEANKAFLDDILSFDGHARADSTTALRYYIWRQSIYEQLDDDTVISSLNAQWRGNIGESIPSSLLLSSVDFAITQMISIFGDTDAAFGDMVRIGRGEEDAPIGGLRISPWTRDICSQTLCEATQRAFWSFPRATKVPSFRVSGGSRILKLVVFTDPIQSFTAHNFGQSENPNSTHYDDQARLLTSKRKLKPVYFERSELEGHVTSTTALTYTPMTSK